MDRKKASKRSEFVAAQAESGRLLAPPQPVTGRGIEVGIVAGRASNLTPRSERQQSGHLHSGFRRHGVANPAGMVDIVMAGQTDDVDIRDEGHGVGTVLAPDRLFGVALRAP